MSNLRVVGGAFKTPKMCYSKYSLLNKQQLNVGKKQLFP